MSAPAQKDSDCKNGTRCRPPVSASETKEAVASVLSEGNGNSHQVAVAVDGDSVTLSGIVSSFLQRRAAELAAWSVPHVQSVHNELRIVRS
jgi:osmotically-inducible protein OsmY